jgi:hypothetical protein
MTDSTSPRRKAAPELQNTLRAMDQHLDNCPDCLRWGYELCDVGFVLSGEVIRARAAREALGLIPGGAPPVPPRPTGPRPSGGGPGAIP